MKPRTSLILGGTPSTTTTTLLLHRQNAVTSANDGDIATDVIISVGGDDDGRNTDDDEVDEVHVDFTSGSGCDGNHHSSGGSSSRALFRGTDFTDHVMFSSGSAMESPIIDNVFANGGSSRNGGGVVDILYDSDDVSEAHDKHFSSFRYIILLRSIPHSGDCEYAPPGR